MTTICVLILNLDIHTPTTFSTYSINRNIDRYKLYCRNLNLKEKEKYLKKLKGPNSSKRLQELPIPILYEILNNIFKNDQDIQIQRFKIQN